MNENKKNELVREEKVTEKADKKVPVIIELGESTLSDVEGGSMAYRCEPAASAAS